MSGFVGGLADTWSGPRGKGDAVKWPLRRVVSGKRTTLDQDTEKQRGLWCTGPVEPLDSFWGVVNREFHERS